MGFYVAISLPCFSYIQEPCRKDFARNRGEKKEPGKDKNGLE